VDVVFQAYLSPVRHSIGPSSGGTTFQRGLGQSWPSAGGEKPDSSQAESQTSTRNNSSTFEIQALQRSSDAFTTAGCAPDLIKFMHGRAAELKQSEADKKPRWQQLHKSAAQLQVARQNLGQRGEHLQSWGLDQNLCEGIAGDAK
jgi:hypothetical protein